MYVSLHRSMCKYGYNSKSACISHPYTCTHIWASQMAKQYIISLPMQETQEMWVQFLSWKDPLESEMASQSNVLAWKISMDREAWQATYSSRGHKKSDKTEHSRTKHMYIFLEFRGENKSLVKVIFNFTIRYHFILYFGTKVSISSLQ